MKALRAVLITTVLGSAMMACERTPSLEWTEDVLLPDGRTVTLERFQEFKRPHAIGEEAGPSYHWFTFKHPTTGEVIRWEEPGELGTVALLFDGDTPYLLARPYYVSSLRDFGCPNPPYLLFRYEAGSWKRGNLQDIPVKRLRSNMTYGGDLPQAQGSGKRVHLSVTVTQNSTHNYQPWVMDLSDVKQVFREKNCNRLPDMRLVPASELKGEQQ